MGVVSVSKITARNYKNIRLEDGIDLGPLTILIGPNGSGKCNFISLLQFLQESVVGAGSNDQRRRTTFEDVRSLLGGAKTLDGTLSKPVLSIQQDLWSKFHQKS